MDHSITSSKRSAVSSWGRLSASLHDVTCFTNPEEVITHIQGAEKPAIPYGMGRSYGDVCLNPAGCLWKTDKLDHFISFNRVTGKLRCEAGVLLGDIQRLFIPQGWCLPVTPGTQIVTVGGAIANDVHGKNHHVKGCFGNHVISIKLVRTDGEIIVCSSTEKRDWLEATIGGMGLTGIILAAEIQLCPTPGVWLETENIAYNGIDTFFSLADSSEKEWEYTVSWIDCLSGDSLRGIFMRGNHTDIRRKPHSNKRLLSVPLTPPFSMVNRLSLRPFNLIYYQLQKWKSGRSVSHYEPFFYPLDNIRNWNRMYGSRGFYQYQMVIPRSAGHRAIAEILKTIAKSGQGSFLAVLKTFGNKKSPGLLSFPLPGVTLALDFPNKGQSTLNLFKQLDRIVDETGGRLYPAKDARMPAALFRKGYNQLNEFVKYKDPGISSGFSRRVMEV